MENCSLVLFFLSLLFLYDSNGQADHFRIQPESVAQADGQEAIFKCLYPDALSHGWGINGVFLPDDQFPPDVIRHPSSGDSPARLIIPATANNNETIIQCRAVVGSVTSFTSVFSNNGTLKVQGRLDSVSSITIESLTISWVPPFSLDLTFADPDIRYCVDVYSVTKFVHLQSVCGIIDTHYTFNVSYPDQLVNFTVTPKSNVAGSLNGTTSQPVQGFLMSMGDSFTSASTEITPTTPTEITPTTSTEISHSTEQESASMIYLVWILVVCVLLLLILGFVTSFIAWKMIRHKEPVLACELNLSNGNGTDRQPAEEGNCQDAYVLTD